MLRTAEVCAISAAAVHLAKGYCRNLASTRGIPDVQSLAVPQKLKVCHSAPVKSTPHPTESAHIPEVLSCRNILCVATRVS